MVMIGLGIEVNYLTSLGRQLYGQANEGGKRPGLRELMVSTTCGKRLPGLVVFDIDSFIVSGSQVLNVTVCNRLIF